MWLSGLGVIPQTKGSQVQFPVRAHAWVVGQVPSRGHVRGNYTLMFLSLSLPPFPSLKKKNKTTMNRNRKTVMNRSQLMLT